jgi:hypothetical protein
MHRSVSRSIVGIACLLLLVAPITHAKPRKKINLEEAVRLAEQFIARNGYTDVPPTKNKSRIAMEHIEWESNIKDILKERHNTLHRKAYGYSRGGRFKDGWIIAFQFTDPCDDGEPLCGRGVSMDAWGRHLLMEHSDANMKVYRKL